MTGVASEVDVAYGDQLWIGRTVGETTTWTEILGIETLNFPTKAPEEVDVTHLRSPGRSRETIPGLMPVADWSQAIQYWPGEDHDVLLESLYAVAEGGERELVLVEFFVEGGARRTYSGYVDDYTPQGTVGDKRMVNLGLKLFDRQETNPRTLPT